jgi:hypothetical protein
VHGPVVYRLFAFLFSFLFIKMFFCFRMTHFVLRVTLHPFFVRVEMSSLYWTKENDWERIALILKDLFPEPGLSRIIFQYGYIPVKPYFHWTQSNVTIESNMDRLIVHFFVFHQVQFAIRLFDQIELMSTIVELNGSWTSTTVDIFKLNPTASKKELIGHLCTAHEEPLSLKWSFLDLHLHKKSEFK